MSEEVMYSRCGAQVNADSLKKAAKAAASLGKDSRVFINICQRFVQLSVYAASNGKFPGFHCELEVSRTDYISDDDWANQRAEIGDVWENVRVSAEELLGACVSISKWGDVTLVRSTDPTDAERIISLEFDNGRHQIIAPVCSEELHQHPHDLGGRIRFQFGPGSMRKRLRSVLRARATDGHRPSLNNVLMRYDEQDHLLTMMTSDQFRLCIAEMSVTDSNADDGEAPAAFDNMVSADDLTAIARLLPAKDNQNIASCCGLADGPDDTLWITMDWSMPGYFVSAWIRVLPELTFPDTAEIIAKNEVEPDEDFVDAFVSPLSAQYVSDAMAEQDKASFHRPKQDNGRHPWIIRGNVSTTVIMPMNR